MSELVQPGASLRPRRGPPRSRSTRRWLLAVLSALGIVAAVVAILVGLSSERRALRAMPPGQRRAVLSATLDELRQFCGNGRPEALADHCRELASFAAEFEECKGECETLVRRELTPPPTR